MKTTYKSIDDYIDSQDSKLIPELDKIRKTIKDVAPKAIEVISKGIPTFKYCGTLVQFAVQKEHIGFYPGELAVNAFEEELAEYITTKIAVQFPYTKPIPYELITNLTKFKVKQNINAKN